MNDVQHRSVATPLTVGPVGTERGVPGDGDALLFNSLRTLVLSYCVIVPQAMRSPALPAGSVFMSSGLAWTISAVPPLPNTE